MNQYLEERYMKTLIMHLEDISKSLKIISGRIEKEEKNESEKDSYAKRYFAKSE